MKSYDLVIIGGGSGGMAAATHAATYAGKSIALVEAKKLGGGSLWSGCVPSKALVRVAHRAKLHTPEKSDEAYQKAKKYIDAAIGKIEKAHDNKEYFQKLGVEVYIGHASFVDKNTVAVGSEKLKAKYFLVATGSTPVVPPIEGLKDVPYLTTDDVFTLKNVPKSMIVVGGGAKWSGAGAGV